MGKICVYTCITGDYDNLIEIKSKEKNIDYYCFTNNKSIKSNTWNVIYIEDKSLSNFLLSRKIKIMGNDIVNKYDIALWMDASVEFKKNINDFINKYMEKDDVFTCFKHGERNNILEEMNACLRFRKIDIDTINNLKEFYKKENYNYDNGLIEATVFIKRPSDKKVQETMKLWFYMVENYAKRDQLSFNYAVFKTGLKVKYINEKVFDNFWFKWIEHNHNKIPNNYMLYFGDINNNYNNDYQIENNYIVKDNKYIIKEKVLNDCSEIYVEVSNCSFLKYKVLKNNYNIINQNTINYDEWNVFFKNPGFIQIKNSFKKGDMIKLEFLFEEVNENFKNELIYDLINKYVNYNNKINSLKFKNDDLESRYKILENSYNSILNSISWKITKPLRKVIKLIKK